MNNPRPIFTLLYFFFLGFSPIAAQQSSLTGKIAAANGEELPYVNIALLTSPEGELRTGAVSDENGEFLISTKETGKFILSVSSLGFVSYESDIFSISAGMEKDFGNIFIHEEISSLAEVTVKGNRPEVLIEADKTIINIEGTVMAEGNTALDVIGRSPGVYVDGDGNINLNGRSGVIVMLDDRPTYMSAEDLANFLRAMPADNIKSIEVINNPPARLDAEGAAGVINLKLKKNDYNGVNGNVQFGNAYNLIHAPFTGGTLNIKKGKWTSNARLNYNEWATIVDLDILRRFQMEEGLSEFDQGARLKLLRKNLFFTGGADYEINERNSLGFNLQLSNSTGTEDGNSQTNINNPNNDQINHLRAINDSESNNQRYFSNLHYVGKLDTLGTKITADIDFTRMDAGSLSLLNNSYWFNEAIANARMDRILTDNVMSYTIVTAKTDFTKAFGKGRTLESGIKGSWVKSDNNLVISKSIEEGPFNPDPNSNEFVYHENVFAGYSSYKSKINETFDFQFGMRAEYSDITGNSVTSNQINRQNYLDLFPSLSFQQKVSDQYKITYNANRRITRPNYRLLNPYVFYIDPLTTEEGNPQLRPQYANNLEMSHIFKAAYQFAFSYSRTQNAFGQVMMQDEDSKKTTIQTQNFDKSENLGLRMMLPVEIAKWWNTSNMVHLYNNKYQTQIGEEFLNMSQFSYMARTQHNINLPKGIKMEMVGMYLSPFLEGQLELRGFGWIDAGITKTFKEDKLSLTVNGTDLFRTQKVRGEIEFDKIDTGFRQYGNNQGIRVTLRWKFSKGENFRVSSSSGSDEERNRLD